KPVEKVQEYSESKVQQITQKEHPKPRFNIDVDLGPDTPSKDVFDFSEDENAQTANVQQEEKPKRKRKQVKDIVELFDDDEIQGEEQTEEKPIVLDDIIKKATQPATPVAEAVTAASSSQKSEEFKVEEKDEPTTDNYVLPSVELLRKGEPKSSGKFGDELKNNAEKLIEILASFGVKATITDICTGPSVTRYELQPAPGVRVSKITGLADDIALSLAASGVRIEAPIPGKAAVGIEVPNKTRQMVTAREIIDTTQFKNGSAKSKLNVALGKDIGGNIICTDLSKMPHLLIAGTTGSGKSVCINSMIVSILYNAKPDEVKLLMIDPKQVEFTVYNGIPHLLVPVVSDPQKASGALNWAVKEMLLRYKMFSNSGVRNIQGYNEMVEKNKDNPELKKMPHIVIFIDEFSDLMMAAPKEIEDSICRLAQMARAAGMHLIIATQRPSVDVITGLIKANIPSRLSLFVSDAMQSRIILDCVGAEKLLGNGDLLFSPVGSTKPTRIQGCFLSDEEVEKVVDFVKNQGNANYDEKIAEEIEKQAAAAEQSKADSDSDGLGESSDALLEDAIKIVVENGQASTSLIQRKLSVGYARAGRIIDQLEERGIIGPYEGSKPRKVNMTKQQWLEKIAMASDDTDEVQTENAEE
ncbi:MAG: DNA translocase FtsK, partial [Clostridiales bacterium]|nr:DNA translocase FtsK [Clostridiales bacterium]